MFNKQKIIYSKDHIHYRIFDDLLVRNGIILAAGITAATVLAAASPWAQMGACLGFIALYTIVGQPLLTLLFRRDKHEKALHNFFMTFCEAIFSPINIVIPCSIAIACGLPFWGGFTTMSALYVVLAVYAGVFVITQPIPTLFSGQNSEKFVPVDNDQKTTLAEEPRLIVSQLFKSVEIEGMRKGGEEICPQQVLAAMSGRL